MITVITGETFHQAEGFWKHMNFSTTNFICPECKKSTTEIVRWAEKQVQTHNDFAVVTMNCDVVSAIRYVSEYYDVKSEFWLVDIAGNGTNYRSNIEPLFAEFNKSIAMIEKYQKD